MKMSKHAERYHEHFKRLRKEFNTKNSNFYYTPSKYFGNDKLTKVLQQYQKYKNVNIFRVDVKQSEHALNTSSTVPMNFDMEIYVHDTPMIIMFSESELYGIITHSTKEQYFPYMYGDDEVDLHPFSTSVMHEQKYDRFIYNSYESKKHIKELHEYIVDDKTYSEEEIALLHYVIPDPHVFIAANELRLHIARNITKNSTVLEMINICSVLNYTNTEQQR